MDRVTAAWNDLVNAHDERVRSLNTAMDCFGDPATAWAATGPVAYAVGRDQSGRLVARVDTDLDEWGGSLIPRALRAIAARPAGLQATADAPNDDAQHIGEVAVLTCSTTRIVSLPMVLSIDNEVVSVAPAITTDSFAALRALMNNETLYVEFASRTQRERGDNYGGVMVAACGQVTQTKVGKAAPRVLTHRSLTAGTAPRRRVDTQNAA